ncbi:MAG: 2-C-methyl-D-erythritol 4-phosphate cytidylyltransferase [Oscillospiraceae bacterium]|nr:2-C-methyl-D-erythritol 4-phosphate cytidylyltransferase [Oscillospiraceae bacterium]
MGILSRLKGKKETGRPGCAAVIVAAGSSMRLGEDKLFINIGEMPCIAHSLLAFENSECIEKIIIVTKPEKIVLMQDVCKDYGITKISDIVRGGDTRGDSVAAGLDRVGGSEYVAIHDGARPFVSGEIIEAAYEAAVKYGAAAPGVPVKDTVKLVSGNTVETTPDRSRLFAIQTPQIFYTGLIKGALFDAKEKGIALTDDCSAVEAIGMSVYITPGDYRNIKITTAEDLVLAEALLTLESIYEQ